MYNNNDNIKVTESNGTKIAYKISFPKIGHFRQVTA